MLLLPTSYRNSNKFQFHNKNTLLIPLIILFPFYTLSTLPSRERDFSIFNRRRHIGRTRMERKGNMLLENCWFSVCASSPHTTIHSSNRLLFRYIYNILYPLNHVPSRVEFKTTHTHNHPHQPIRAFHSHRIPTTDLRDGSELGSGELLSQPLINPPKYIKDEWNIFSVFKSL